MVSAICTNLLPTRFLHTNQIARDDLASRRLMHVQRVSKIFGTATAATATVSLAAVKCVA